MTTRREWLRWTGLALGATALAGLLPPSVLARRPLRALRLRLRPLRRTDIHRAHPWAG